MKQWYVYIILTSKDRLYTGVSVDPERRFLEHLCDPKKGAKFFRSDSPVKIVYLEKVNDYSTALKREIAIKKLSPSKKRQLINLFTF